MIIIKRARNLDEMQVPQVPRGHNYPTVPG